MNIGSFYLSELYSLGITRIFGSEGMSLVGRSVFHSTAVVIYNYVE